MQWATYAGFGVCAAWISPAATVPSSVSTLGSWSSIVSGEPLPLDAVDIVVALLIGGFALFFLYGQALMGGSSPEFFPVILYAVIAMVFGAYTNWFWTRGGGYGVIGACILANPFALSMVAAVNALVGWIRA